MAESRNHAVRLQYSSGSTSRFRVKLVHLAQQEFFDGLRTLYSEAVKLHLT